MNFAYNIEIVYFYSIAVYCGNHSSWDGIIFCVHDKYYI